MIRWSFFANLKEFCEKSETLSSYKKRLVFQSWRNSVHVHVNHGSESGKFNANVNISEQEDSQQVRSKLSWNLMQRSHMMTMTLLRTTVSSQMSSSRAKAATHFFASDSFCRHNFPKKLKTTCSDIISWDFGREVNNLPSVTKANARTRDDVRDPRNWDNIWLYKKGTLKDE